MEANIGTLAPRRPRNATLRHIWGQKELRQVFFVEGIIFKFVVDVSEISNASCVPWVNDLYGRGYKPCFTQTFVSQGHPLLLSP